MVPKLLPHSWRAGRAPAAPIRDESSDGALELSLLSPAVGTANIGDHFIELAIRRALGSNVRFSRFSVRRPLSREEIDAINRTSGALLCGTNLYQREWACALDARTLGQIRVPVIPFGVGSSAVGLDEVEVGRTTRTMIRALHDRCVTGSVRDPHSLELVRRTGVENVTLTGCPVLHWAQTQALPEVESRKRSRVVITARNWLMHREPYHLDNPVQIALLRHLVKELPEMVVFAVHEEFDRAIIDRLGIPPSAVFDSDRPDDYVQLYTDPDNVVLASRLHAGMLALANGVPAVFVGHDTRTYSFCEMVGLKSVDLFDERAADESLARLTRIIDGDTSEFNGINRSYRTLHQAMSDFLQANGIPGTAAATESARDGVERGESAADRIPPALTHPRAS